MWEAASSEIRRPTSLVSNPVPGTFAVAMLRALTVPAEVRSNPSVVGRSNWRLQGGVVVSVGVGLGAGKGLGVGDGAAVVAWRKKPVMKAVLFV